MKNNKISNIAHERVDNASFALDNHKSWSCNKDLIDGLLSDN